MSASIPVAQPGVRFFVRGIGLSPSTPNAGNATASNPPDASTQPIHRALPEELMLEIFSYLRPRWLGRASLVCRDWKRIATDGDFLKQMTIFYEAVVREHRARTPHFIRASPGGNMTELLRRISPANRSTLDAYMAAAKKYTQAVAEYQEQKVYLTTQFATKQREHLETYPAENMQRIAHEEPPHEGCCAGCSVCGLKCTLL